MVQTTTPKLSYEMVIRDAQTNDLLVNQDVAVTVNVYNASNLETALYTEDMNLTTDNNGILIVAFGEDVNWQEQGVNWMNAEIHFEIDYSFTVATNLPSSMLSISLYPSIARLFSAMARPSH